MKLKTSTTHKFGMVSQKTKFDSEIDDEEN